MSDRIRTQDCLYTERLRVMVHLVRLCQVHYHKPGVLPGIPSCLSKFSRVQVLVFCFLSNPHSLKQHRVACCTMANSSSRNMLTILNGSMFRLRIYAQTMITPFSAAIHLVLSNFLLISMELLDPSLFPR